MVLTVDIGNTNIVMGLFSGDELKFTSRVSTDITKTEDEYGAIIRSILSIREIDAETVSGAIISSVVPPLNSIFKKAVKLVFGTDAVMVGPGIKTGINIKCDDPSSVGADLICACVAAHHIYGSPSLVVDMGTATKILLMDETGAFSGASIIPGVLMGLKTLSSGTAQLPLVGLEPPKFVSGKNTVDCIKSGVIFGNASLLDGMIERFCEEYGKELPVYATGGLAATIVRHCSHKITLDESLILKGLNILYTKNHK